MTRCVLLAGSKPTFVGEYRITDAEALTAAIHAAEEVRSMLAAKLSAGPSISNVHRHGDGSRWHAVNVTVDCNCYIGARVRMVFFHSSSSENHYFLSVVREYGSEFSVAATVFSLVRPLLSSFAEERSHQGH